MKRQLYYPARAGEQLLWLKNFRDKLLQHAATLSLTSQTLDSALADLAWLIFFKSEIIGRVRRHALACSQVERDLMSGKGTNVVTVPPFEMPPPPAGVPPVKPGALDRIFKLVATIKHTRGYTVEMGHDLGIVGNHHRLADPAAPAFKLTLVRGATSEGVRGKFSRFGHTAVWVETRRGGGDFETLGHGVFPGTVFEDFRPLLDPTLPEIREYRLRFWDKGEPNGEWTPVATVAVSP